MAVLLGLVGAVIIGVGISMAADPIGQVTYVPTGINPGCGLYDIATDLDGNVWFTDWGCQYEAHRITPPGTLTNYHLDLGNAQAPCSVALGPSGAMWFLSVEEDRMWKVDPDGTTTAYDTGIPALGGSCPGGLAAGPDGNMWFTGNHLIGKMTPSGAVTTYALPASTFPLSITGGPDGNVWFATLNTISSISPDGSITDYPLPFAPGEIVTGPDGNLWFPEPSNRFGRMTVSGVRTDFSTSISAGASGIAVGPDGALWFTEFFGDRIGRITTSGEVTEYDMPAGIRPGPLTAGGDGNMWVIANDGTDAIWRVGTSSIADADGDGVDDRIDTGDGTFDDGAGTTGSITNAAGNDVLVAPDPDGVRITVDGGGAGQSSFSVCGFTLLLSPGSDVVVTCGSITVEVISGAAEVTFGDGLGSITVPEGVTAHLAEQPDGSFSLDHLAGGEPIRVTINGVSGSLAPGDSLALETWRFIGFGAPVDNDGVLNQVKAGSTVPLKWQLLDAAGAPVSDLTSASVSVRSLECAAGTAVDQLEETSPGGAGLQNLGDGYYQLNWKTPKSYANSCKTLRLDVGDGVLHVAGFTFTR